MGRGDDEDDDDDEDYRDDAGPASPMSFFRRRTLGDTRGTMENPISLVDDDEVELVSRGPRPFDHVIDLTAEEEVGAPQPSSSSSSSSSMATPVASQTTPPIATQEPIPSSSSSSSGTIATYVASYSIDGDSGEVRRVRQRLA